MQPYGPKTNAQIAALVEQGKIAIVGYPIGDNTALLVERYDKEGRAHRQTIEIKETKPSRAAQHRADAATRYMGDDQEQTDAETARQSAIDTAIATVPPSEHDASAGLVGPGTDEEQMHARIISINGTPYADILAEQTTRAAALADRPIYSAEKKAKNRLDHAAARLAEAMAYHAAAQAEYDAIHSTAELDWLSKKAAAISAAADNAIKP